MLDIKDDHEWTNMTLKEFLKKYLFNKEKQEDLKQRRDRVSKSLHDLPENYQHVAEENAKQLDKHMVWISGGALYVIVTLFTSDKFPALCNTSWLIAALVAFGVSLLCVVSSYRSEAAMLNKMPGVQNLTDNLMDFMHSVKENADMDEAWRKAEKKWKKLTRSVRWGLMFTKVTPAMNYLAYFLFVIGMVSFLIFGTMSLLNTPHCMNDDPNDNGEQQSTDTVEKSADLTGPMFNEVVDGIPGALTGSGEKPPSGSGGTNEPQE